jgi:7-cyano-7-deazaguanine tRNA-ribosyltransferase
MLKKQRTKTLTEHNLYATMSEMRRVKQAITEGSLWELIEIRSRAHPAMASAFKSLKMYKKELEKFSPGYKGRGIFFFGHESINRPEVTRHTIKLNERHAPINAIKILLLIPAPRWKPFSSSKEFQRFRDTIEKELGETTESIQICFFSVPFGVVPLELTESFPLSQFEISKPLDHETIQHTAELVESYFNKSNFQETLLVAEKGELDRLLFRKFKDIGTDTDREIHILTVENVWSMKIIEEIVSALKRMIKN